MREEHISPNWLWLLSVLVVTVLVFVFRGTSLNPNAHGLAGDYFGSVAHKEILLSHTVDRELTFESPLRLRGVFTTQWKVGAFPFPSTFPLQRVRWEGQVQIDAPAAQEPQSGAGVLFRHYRGTRFRGSPAISGSATVVEFNPRDPLLRGLPSRTSSEWIGRVRIESPGRYEFKARANGFAGLYIGSTTVFEESDASDEIPIVGGIELGQGEHDFRVRYSSNDRFLSTFSLQWQPPGSASAQIPAAALLPPRNRGSTLTIESPAAISLTVDSEERRKSSGGRFLFSPDVSPGIHNLKIEMRNETAEPTLMLGWVDESGIAAPIPAAALEPAAASAGPPLLLWTLMLIVLAIPILFRRRAVWGVLILLLSLGALLRFHEYTIVPPHGATRDEFNEAWIGWSLLTRGTAVGWSLTPVFDNLTFTPFFDRSYPIVQPALHPPPLSSRCCLGLQPWPRAHTIYSRSPLELSG